MPEVPFLSKDVRRRDRRVAARVLSTLIFRPRMALVVAYGVGDGEILHMAAAAFAEWLDVLQRGILGFHMLATNPARHRSVQLAGHGPVNLQARMTQLAHEKISGRFI